MAPPTYQQQVSQDRVFTLCDELISDCLATNFARLKGVTYLDHAGTTPYPTSLLDSVMDDLKRNLYGNPHSGSNSSQLSSEAVDHVRFLILQHFNTTCDEYSVVFTSGCTASLKLVAETFDFTDSGKFLYHYDNHTSVVGMREIIDAQSECVDVMTLDLDSDLRNALVAFPAQSNFSGYRYPLSKIEEWKKKNDCVFVLLDAAAFVSTSDLDLEIHRPDFVSLSFYKMFGYPTGLGALLVKNSSAHLLKKKYFGGGSIDVSLTSSRFHSFKKKFNERFEDGTLPFLDIIAVRHGFKCVKKIAGCMEDLCLHSFKLAELAFKDLSSYRHGNGTPVAKVYRHGDYVNRQEQGPLVNFNLIQSDGSYVGYSEVDKLAQSYNIHLRTGCFCNLGACQHFLAQTDQQLVENFQAGHVCGDDRDIINGLPTGSIRISFGLSSTLKDVKKFLSFVKECFVDDAVSMATEFPIEEKEEEAEEEGVLRNIFLYPIKSCGAFEVSQWPLGDRGLLHDRGWMVINAAGICLSQKRLPKMCLIRPHIDLKAGTLTLSRHDMDDGVSVPLIPDSGNEVRADSKHCMSKVCGDRVQGTDCGKEVAEWLDRALDQEGLRLVHQNVQDQRTNRRLKKGDAGPKQSLSLANEGQFLLINRSSVEVLLKHVQLRRNSLFSLDADDMIGRFRANLVIESRHAFSEESWCSVQLGQTKLSSLGHCNRCQMICIDQSTGEQTKEPLVSLMTFRDKKSHFGILLSHCLPSDHGNEIMLTVGSRIVAKKM